MPEEKKLTPYEIANIRLKCAEIVFLSGSQHHKINLEQEAERIYNFVMDTKMNVGSDNQKAPKMTA